VGQKFFKIGGRNQILIFAMLAKEVGDVRAQRNHAQMISAGKIERGMGELCGHAMAFDRRRNLRVVENDAVGKEVIGKERAKAVHGGFEAVSFFVVDDSDGVEV